jgi:flagellar basal body rod protein FlgC
MNESAVRVAGLNADPVVEAVEQLQIKTGFEANVFTLETARDMERSAIRLWA